MFRNVSRKMSAFALCAGALLALPINAAPKFVPPSIGKAFSPSSFATGTSNLVITLTNPNKKVATLTAPLTDVLPAGMAALSVNNNSCGGTVTITNSNTTIVLTGGSIPAAVKKAPGSCSFSVAVTAATGSNYDNTIPAGALQTDKGNSQFGVCATFNAFSPSNPVISVGKSFTPSTIEVNQMGAVTITINNLTGSPATLAEDFVDNLGGLVLSAPFTDCNNGAGAQVVGSNLVLLGGSVIAPGQCTLSATVVATTPVNYINNIPVGALTTNEGSNAQDACATLTAVDDPPSAPSVEKSFEPDEICIFDTTWVTITLVNPTDNDASIISFEDRLPRELKIIKHSAFNGCGGDLDLRHRTITLTGGTIPANDSCLIRVEVEPMSCGDFINNIPVGALDTDIGANENATVAFLRVNDDEGRSNSDDNRYTDDDDSNDAGQCQ